MITLLYLHKLYLQDLLKKTAWTVSNCVMFVTDSEGHRMQLTQTWGAHSTFS